MKNLLSLISLLPKYEEIKYILENEAEAAYIMHLVIENTNKIGSNPEHLESLATEESNYLLQCLANKYWERIHTGHFNKVPVETRQIFSLANYFKIFYLLFESTTKQQVEKCSTLLDEAMLIGTKVPYKNNDALQLALMKYCNDLLIDASAAICLPILEPWQRKNYRCDIPRISCPSVEQFSEKCFQCQQPALLLDTIKHWPALEKWRDLNYILKVAGNRTVPIEIGSNYATDEWSQQLKKICDFLQRQFAPEEEKPEIEYLAQHELFDQVPSLKADICIPDYCILGNNPSNVDIKAWLGPKDTISPMHYDPKHNLLCQVFGAKSIILAAPVDTCNLYPHETEFLSNTSQIDAANLDFIKFPLAAGVRFYQLTLQAGDCLYMPPKWWHYIRSESESFSVSFWWE